MSALHTLSAEMALDTSRVTPQEFSQMLLTLFQTFFHHALQTCRERLRGHSGSFSRRNIRAPSENLLSWDEPSFPIPKPLLPLEKSTNSAASQPILLPCPTDNIRTALPAPMARPNPGISGQQVAAEAGQSFSLEGGTIVGFPFPAAENENLFSAPLPVRPGEISAVGRDTCNLCFSQPPCSCFDNLFELVGNNDEPEDTFDEIGMAIG